MKILSIVVSLLGMAGMAAAQGLSWQEAGGSATLGGISNTAAFHSQMPSLALTASGTPFVAWVDAVSGNNEIYIKRWNGTQWVGLDGGAEATNVSATAAESMAPSLALDAAGNPCVAWQEQVAVGNTDIMLRRWTGSAWSGMEASSAFSNVSGTGANSTSPSLALDAAGRPVVAWCEGGWNFLRRWNGTAWTDYGGSGMASGVTNSPLSAGPRLVLNANDRPVLAWVELGIPQRLFLRLWDGGGWRDLEGSGSGGGVYTPESGSTVINGLSLALDPAGAPIVAWADSTLIGNYEVYLRHWTGTEWAGMGSSVDNVSGTTKLSKTPTLAVDGSGKPVVAWGDVTSGNYEIYLRRWTGAEWTEVDGSATGGGISANAGISAGPALAIDLLGRPWISWSEGPVGDGEIYVRRGMPLPAPPSVPGALAQFLADGVQPLATGARVTAAGIVFKASADDPTLDAIRLQVEVQPVGVAFTGIPAATGDPGPSGSLLSVGVHALPDFSGCHWQVRAIDEGGLPSRWTSFGSMPDHPSEIDFLTPFNTPPTVVSFDQVLVPGGNALAAGRRLMDSDGAVVSIRGSADDADATDRVRLEIELRPLGESFTGIATGDSDWVGGGVAVEIPVTVGEGAYHWRIRSVDDRGKASEWISFGGNSEGEADFAFTADGSAGPSSCLQSGAARSGSGVAAIAALLLLRRRRRAGVALVLVLAAPASAQTWSELGTSASVGGVSKAVDWNDIIDRNQVDFTPSLALDAEGFPVIAWSDARADLVGVGRVYPAIYVRRWSGGGWVGMDGSDASVDVSAKPGSNCRSPVILIDGTGHPVVAWQDTVPSNPLNTDDYYFNFEINVRRWDGVAWVGMDGTNASVNVSNTSAHGTTSQNVSMALDATGAPVVAWEEKVTPEISPVFNTEIHVRRWDRVSKAWVPYGSSGSGGGVSATADPSFTPTLALESSGAPVVAWQEGGVNSIPARIFLRRWNGLDWVELGGSASGNGIGHAPPAPAPVADWPMHPSLALDAAGLPIVAWRDDYATPGNHEICLRRWNGSSWVGMDGGPAVSNVSGTAGDSQSPVIAIDPSGHPVVAWADDTAGNFEIYLRRWSGAQWLDLGGSAAAGGISANAGASIRPALKIDGAGNPGVAWLDATELWMGAVAMNQVYYRRFRPAPAPPDVPAALSQLQRAGGQAIPPGGRVADPGFMASARVRDLNEDTVRLEIEVRPVGIPFNGMKTAAGGFQVSGGAASVTVDGLNPGQSYHWQIRAVDETAPTSASAWVSFGTTPENPFEADLSVDAHETPPPPPSGGHSSCLHSGGNGGALDGIFLAFLAAMVALVWIGAEYSRPGKKDARDL